MTYDPGVSSEGGPGNDTLIGTALADTIRGGAGDDVVAGVPREAMQTFADGRRPEPLYVVADAEPGADRLFGDAGFDILYGGGGPDTLSGGEGYDRLDGGAGADVLTGGPQSDTFVVGYPTTIGRPPQTGIGAAADRITDFEPGQDVIDLRAFWNFGDPGVNFRGNAPLVFDQGNKLQIAYRYEGPDTVISFWDGHNPARPRARSC